MPNNKPTEREEEEVVNNQQQTGSQLDEEGASLQELKDEARRERAIELLNRTNRSVKQVAIAVGFRNEKSFSRAFKQWTGASPGEYRGRHGSDGNDARK